MAYLNGPWDQHSKKGVLQSEDAGLQGCVWELNDPSDNKTYIITAQCAAAALTADCWLGDRNEIKLLETETALWREVITK